jgi:hypothetical protein
LYCITSVPKKFGFVYTYVPSGVDNHGSVCWSTHCVVVTTSGVPSGSLSALLSPTVGLSSVVVLVSLSTIGASFTDYRDSQCLFSTNSWCSRVTYLDVIISVPKFGFVCITYVPSD